MAELREALDERGDLSSERFLHLCDADVGILRHVME